jgi:hypothetical protein
MGIDKDLYTVYYMQEWFLTWFLLEVLMGWNIGDWVEVTTGPLKEVQARITGVLENCVEVTTNYGQSLLAKFDEIKEDKS